MDIPVFIMKKLIFLGALFFPSKDRLYELRTPQHTFGDENLSILQALFGPIV